MRDVKMLRSGMLKTSIKLGFRVRKIPKSEPGEVDIEYRISELVRLEFGGEMELCNIGFHFHFSFLFPFICYVIIDNLKRKEQCSQRLRGSRHRK